MGLNENRKEYEIDKVKEKYFKQLLQFARELIVRVYCTRSTKANIWNK